MREWIGRFTVIVAATVLSSGAQAMSAPGRCNVVASEKHATGSDTICAEVERAIASRAPNVSYSAEIEFLSSTRLAARLVVNGRALPEQRFAVMDRELDRAAVQRFAQSLAIEVAMAADR